MTYALRAFGSPIQIVDNHPYKDAILADKPMIYYRLDDAGNIAVDSSGNGYNGTLSGNTDGQTGALVSEYNYSVALTATGKVAAPSAFNPSKWTSLSFEYWIKLSGGWQYVAVTCSNTGGTLLYLNGVPYTSGSGDTIVIDLHALYSGSFTASGNMDEVAVYNYVLTPTQVLNHYSIGSGVTYGGFALWANGTGTAKYDSFRVVQYPDPSATLVNAGRATSSIVNWNANIPSGTSLTTYTSVDDGASYQIATAGTDIAGISTLLYSTLVFQKKPVAYYHFGESSGTNAVDSSGNGYNGTYGGTYTLAQPGVLQGPGEIANTSIKLDGTSGKISLPSGLNLSGWSAFSIGCWFNPSASVGSTTYLIANDNPSSSHNGIAIGINASLAGCFATIGNGTTSATATFSTTLSINTWYYLEVTWDATTITLYLNGTSQATVSLSGSVGTAAANVAIGYNPVLVSGYCNGLVNEVDFANPTYINSTNILLASDVFARYNAGLAGIGQTGNDTFTADTHTSYTQTFGTGGSAATWTWDTANSRLSAVGGSKAHLLYNNLWAYDTDILVDFYQAENSGFIWGYQDASNYYSLIIKDAQASSGANTVTLNKVVANATTQLATTSIAWQVVSGGITTYQVHHRFHMTMLGGIITVSMDENTILTYTDASPFPAGLAGLRNDTGTSYIYQLIITPQPVDVSSRAIVSKHVMTTNSPTVTPQLTDHQAMAGDPTFATGVLVPSADYRQTYVSDNVDDLNTKSNYWWQVSPSKNIVFQPRNATNSPWILQSTDVLINTLPTVEYSGDLYRNKQTLKGVYDTATFGQIFNGNNQTRTWNVANPIVAVPTITLNGLTVTVGEQGKDTGKQYYYTFNDVAINQDNSQALLQDTDVLAVTYTGAFGIDFSVDNTGQFSNTISQSQLAATDGTDGIIEAVEDVSSQNMNVAAATAYANSLLQRYGSIARTIKFQTLHGGLKPGHNLPIFIPQLNIFDSTFLVVEVNTSTRTVTLNGVTQVQYVYDVTCSEIAAMASWVKMFSKIMRSVTGSKAKV